MGKFFLALLVITVLIYLVVRLIDTRGAFFRRTPSSRPPRPAAGQRPLGPDDDPDFLRDLNRKRPRKDPDAGND